MKLNIKNWNEYKNWVETIAEKKLNYFYRGQLLPSWQLKTTFHRKADDAKLQLIDYLNHVIPEIHYYVCAHHNEIFNLQIPDEFGAFLALLQHHGFPTPLLDWTLSPYIAVYFAFREVSDINTQTDNVKIFIFDYQSWTTKYEQPLDLLDQTKNYVSVIRPYAKYNSRLIPQRGVYTVTNVSDMEAHIQLLAKKANQEFIWTIELPVCEKPKIMRDLNLMGINEMTMFPGVDGICRSFKEQFFSKDFIIGPMNKKLLEEYLKGTKK